MLVSETAPVREALARFYGALERPFRPEGVADLPVGVDRVIQALSEEVRDRYGASSGEIGDGTLKNARSGRERWRYIPETGSAL